MTEDRMPERLFVMPSDRCGYAGSPHQTEEDDTEYVRRDQLDKALDALWDMCNRTKDIGQSKFKSKAHYDAFIDAFIAAQSFLSTHRPLTDRGNQ